MKECPHCDGVGKIIGFGCPGFRRIERPCALCESTGRVALEILDRVQRGREIRRRRIEIGLSLRELAKAARVSPVELGEVERGLREPSGRLVQLVGVQA